MSAKRYLALVAGRIKQLAAVVISAGSANDGDLVALDAAGKIDASVMPSGFGQNSVPAVASENLAAGDLVNLYNNAGSIGARKTDATVEGKECQGFVKTSVTSGGTATVYTSGNILTGLTGLTPGTRQYLSTTPGQRTETAPSAAGNVVQLLGVSTSASSLVLEPEEPITVA